MAMAVVQYGEKIFPLRQNC